MNPLRALLTSLALGSLAFGAGCAAAHDHASAEENVAEEPSEALSSSSKLPAPAVATQRLYFPNTTTALPSLGGSKAWPYPIAPATTVASYWVFGAKGGSTFDVTVSALQDGDAITTAPVSASIYYLSRGRWRKYRGVSGTGTVATTLTPSYDHQWLVLAKGDVGSSENNLEVALGCTDGSNGAGHSLCALAQQPADACGGLAASAFVCDGGLFCDYGATCGTGDQQGKCAQSPTTCGTKGVSPMPACGCDGTTYASECQAHVAGVSVASAGVCGAPPPPATCDWTATPTNNGVLNGTTWRSADLKNTYTFTADKVQAINDICAAPPEVIHCLAAARVKNGTYFAKGANVTVSYDDGTTAHLVHQTDCTASAMRLDGDDWGGHVDTNAVAAR